LRALPPAFAFDRPQRGKPEHSAERFEWPKSGPVADVVGVSPVPVQMWPAASRRVRCHDAKCRRCPPHASWALCGRRVRAACSAPRVFLHASDGAAACGVFNVATVQVMLLRVRRMLLRVRVTLIRVRVMLIRVRMMRRWVRAMLLRVRIMRVARMKSSGCSSGRRLQRNALRLARRCPPR
jgi:hypothetical protein